MEFLLECIGIPPETDPDELLGLVRREGEPVAFRGPGGEHLRLVLAEGIELRLDRDPGDSAPTLLPYFAERSRLRIATTSVREVPDSPFDALLTGWVAPPTPEMAEYEASPGAYVLACWLTDARRLPRTLGPGRVLAISVAGFALDVAYLGVNSGVCRPEILEKTSGADIRPLGGIDDPGGCSEVSARIKAVRHIRNRLTGVPVDVLEVDAPDRALHLFVSPWQLEAEGFPSPRPGYRVEGTFLFTGRIAGGLPGPRRKARKHFG